MNECQQFGFLLILLGVCTRLRTRFEQLPTYKAKYTSNNIENKKFIFLHY